MKKCYSCGILIQEADLTEALKRETTFRKNFPQTWHKEDRVLICTTCFDRVSKDEDTWLWEALNGETEE